MATRPRWLPSASNFLPRQALAVSFTNWTTCESLVPSKQQEQLKPELKALFYQKDRQAADQVVAAFIEKYQKIYPTAIECLQRDLEACLTFYAFPKEHWKTIRTIMYNQGVTVREKAAHLICNVETSPRRVYISGRYYLSRWWIIQKSLLTT
jgi:Transposase, Mutator family